jgi:DNA-binding transcriptional regulator/RsmH inhibitor MraZ
MLIGEYRHTMDEKNRLSAASKNRAAADYAWFFVENFIGSAIVDEATSTVKHFPHILFMSF